MSRLVRRAGLWLALVALAGFEAAGQSTTLVEAVKRGDHAAVRTLTRNRAEVNRAEPDGTTPLHYATQANDVELMSILLKAGANAKAANALRCAADHPGRDQRQRCGHRGVAEGRRRSQRHRTRRRARADDRGPRGQPRTPSGAC